MPPSIASIAQSDSKEKLFERLGWAERSDADKSLYALMKVVEQSLATNNSADPSYVGRSCCRKSADFQQHRVAATTAEGQATDAALHTRAGHRISDVPRSIIHLSYCETRDEILV